MEQGRRTFLKTLTLGFAGAGFFSALPEYLLTDNTEKFKNGIEFENGAKLFNEIAQKNIEALAHLIIPGSKNIDIKNILLNFFSKNFLWARYFDKGFRELNTVAQSRFNKPLFRITGNKNKNEVAVAMEKKKPEFFKNFKNLVIKFYYSHPRSWKGLAYNGPPQPVGFSDYSLPPKK